MPDTEREKQNLSMSFGSRPDRRSEEKNIEDRSMTKQSSDSSANLPPDYELDDYWMQQVVLKDPKDEETEFYSAYAYFSTLYPLPEYVVKRAAAAPPYDWYKHHPFSNYVESVASQEKKKIHHHHHKHKRSLINKVSTAAAPSHLIEDQNQQQFDHHQADHSRKSSAHDQITFAAHVPSAMTRMPILRDQEEFINNLITTKMGGCDHLMLVIQKKLRDSDVNRQQNRFSIPFLQVLNEFLNSDEEAWLTKKETRNIEVNLLIFNLQQQQQPYLEEDKVHNVNFTKWYINSMYVLNGPNWSTVVQQHKLEKHMPVELWAFRLHSQLSFTIVKT